MSNERNPWNEYQRQYRQKNPDKVKKWRLNTLANELRKAGYFVTEPPAVEQDQTAEVAEDPDFVIVNASTLWEKGDNADGRGK